MTVQTIVLDKSKWSDYYRTQIVTVPGVSRYENTQFIFPTPSADSQQTFYESGVQCLSQGPNKLNFGVSKIPEKDITVYVGIVEVKNGNI